MRNKLIMETEAKHFQKKPPVFEIGDYVSVGIRIKEGNKVRVQPFIGTIIAQRGAGTGATFTVRRIVNNEGVERIFPLHSPHIESVEVQRKGMVRRSKLYYLRQRVGKARKLKERRVNIANDAESTAAKAANAAAEAARPRKSSAKQEEVAGAV